MTADQPFAVDRESLTRASKLLRAAGEQVGAGRLPQATADLGTAMPASMSAWASQGLLDTWQVRVALVSADAIAAGELLEALAAETAALDRFLADAADGDLDGDPGAPGAPRRGSGPVLL